MNQYKTFKYPYSYPYPYPGTHSGTRTHPYPGTHTRTRTRTHVVPIIGTRTRTHTQNWYPYPGTNARTRTRTRTHFWYPTTTLPISDISWIISEISSSGVLNYRARGCNHFKKKNSKLPNNPFFLLFSLCCKVVKDHLAMLGGPDLARGPPFEKP